MATCLLLRLPHELAVLFPEWLKEHYPMRRDRVLKAMRMLRGDKQQGNSLNDSGFGQRFVGIGPRAELIQRRFELACKRYGLAANREHNQLNTDLFRPPVSDKTGRQRDLFDLD